MNFLEEMRQRPDEEKFAFAIMVAGAVGFVLFVAWGFTSLRGSGSTSVHIPTKQQPASVIGSFSEVRSEVSKTSQEVLQTYEQLRQQIENSGVAPQQGEHSVRVYTDEEGEVQVENVIKTQDTSLQNNN